MISEKVIQRTKFKSPDGYKPVQHLSCPDVFQ